MLAEKRDSRHFRWVWIGLAVMFVLIGIATIIDAYYNRARVGMFGFFPFGFFWWIIILFVAFWLFRWIFWGGWEGHAYRRAESRHGDAYYILKERYASGKISKKEYTEKMRDLDDY